MSEPSKPFRKRRRPAFSCQECRRRKIKCDRACPCKYCRQTNTTCSYSEGAAPLNYGIAEHSSPACVVEPPASTPEIPVTSLSLGHLSISNIRNPRSQQPPQKLWKSASTSEEYTEDSPKVRVLLEKVQRLEQLLSERMPDGVSRVLSPPISIVPHSRLRGTLSKTRFYGQSHWMNSIAIFDTIATTRDSSSMPTPGLNNAIMMTNVHSVLKKCKAMAKASKIRIHDEWLADSDFRTSVPSLEICDLLLNAYFRTSESAFRIFHIPTFKKEYNRYKSQPHLASDSFILTMLLAMSIGVIFYQEPDAEILRTQAKKWVYAAQSWLSEIPYEKSRLNIAGLQLHCLLLIARQSLAIVDDLVWISTGSLLRRAFSLGLHRDPKHFPNMNVLQAEIRRRLWATIIELNVQLSVESGMRPLICFDDFDTEAPANINDEDIDENTSAQPISKPSNIFTQTSIQIILLSSLRTRIEIVQICNALSTDPSYEDVSRLGGIIATECKERSSFVREIQRQKANMRPTQLQCNMLDFYLRRFVLILYGPFATQHQDNPWHYFSRKLCLDSSMKIVSYASSENGTKQSLTDYPYDDYTCLRTHSGGFFESVVIHSMIIIFLELVTQLKEQDSFIEQSREFRQPLKNVLHDACDLLALRVSVAENNAKGHLLFSAALGQIEAVEAGTSPYQGAVEGAKKSAEICLKLLANKEPLLTPESEDTLENEVNFGIQDWSMDFVMPDSWLLSGWDSNQ